MFNDSQKVIASVIPQSPNNANSQGTVLSDIFKNLGIIVLIILISFLIVFVARRLYDIAQKRKTMSSRAEYFASSSRNGSFSTKKSSAVAIISFFIPIGIQDFYVCRYAWGFFHLFAAPCVLPWVELSAFDVLLGSPTIFSFIANFFLSVFIVSIILNCIECNKLLKTGRIDMEKTGNFVLFSVFIIMLILCGIELIEMFMA